MPAAIRTVIFDLGGVLADFGGVSGMKELAGIDTDEQVFERWLACEWVRSFERGDCDAIDFASGVVTDWKLAITPDEFVDLFRSWLVAPFPGAHDLILEVKERMPVGCLSNTNSIHWDGGARTHLFPL